MTTADRKLKSMRIRHGSCIYKTAQSNLIILSLFHHLLARLRTKCRQDSASTGVWPAGVLLSDMLKGIEEVCLTAPPVRQYEMPAAVLIFER